MLDGRFPGADRDSSGERVYQQMVFGARGAKSRRGDFRMAGPRGAVNQRAFDSGVFASRYHEGLLSGTWGSRLGGEAGGEARDAASAGSACGCCGFAGCFPESADSVRQPDCRSIDVEEERK